MGWFSSVKTFKGINKQVWAEYMLIFLCVPKLASGRGWDMDFCPTLKMLRHIQGEQSDLHISCNFNFLSPFIFSFPTLKSLNFSWSYASKLLNRVGARTSVCKTFPFGSQTMQTDGRVFPLTSNRKISLDHKQGWKRGCLLLYSWRVKHAEGIRWKWTL